MCMKRSRELSAATGSSVEVAVLLGWIGLGTLGVTCAVAARAAVTEMFFPLFVRGTEKLAGVAWPLPAAADVPY